MSADIAAVVVTYRSAETIALCLQRLLLGTRRSDRLGVLLSQLRTLPIPRRLHLRFPAIQLFGELAMLVTKQMVFPQRQSASKPWLAGGPEQAR